MKVVKICEAFLIEVVLMRHAMKARPPPAWRRPPRCRPCPVAIEVGAQTDTSVSSGTAHCSGGGRGAPADWRGGAGAGLPPHGHIPPHRAAALPQSEADAVSNTDNACPNPLSRGVKSLGRVLGIFFPDR